MKFIYFLFALFIASCVNADDYTVLEKVKVKIFASTEANKPQVLISEICEKCDHKLLEMMEPRVVFKNGQFDQAEFIRLAKSAETITASVYVENTMNKVMLIKVLN